MPPRRFSRFSFSSAMSDDEERLFLTERVPYRFRDLSDNRRHIVVAGDTLFNLARRYFTPLPRPDGLWWVIADFQPEPIIDGTLALDIGRMLVIPSLRTVEEDIFSERRRGEAIP